MRDGWSASWAALRRNGLILAVLFAMTFSSGFVAAGAVPIHPGAPASGASSTGGPMADPVHPAPHAPAWTPHPLVATATYYANATGFAVPPFSGAGCSQTIAVASVTSIDDTCYPLAIDPTIFQLGNGNTAISYEVNTNATGSTCAGSGTNATTAIGFAISSTGGISYGTPTILANRTCAFLQAIEPSFAASGSSVYGTFIEENDSTVFPGTYGSTSPRWNDAIAFVKSTNNGVTWGAPLTINTSGNLAHPVLAAVGQTIYIVWENLSYDNSTSVCSGGPFLYGRCSYDAAVRLFFVASTNGGSSWSNPQLLAGQNISSDDFSIGPSIGVNKTGTLAVAFFTNLSCAQMLPPSGCLDYGLDLVVRTSTSNGTTWSPFSVVARSVGISNEFDGGSFQLPPSDWIPQSQLIFDPSGQTIYLTWSGEYNKTVAPVYDQWCCGGIFFAAGPTTLGTWTVATVSTTSDWGNNYDDMFNPAVGLDGGTVYVAYTWNNETQCSPCLANQYLTGSFNERLRWSTDGGLTWQGGLVLQAAKMAPGCSTYCVANQFPGSSASIDTGTSAGPLVAYALPGQPTSSFQSAGSTDWFNTSYPTNLSVSFPYTGATVSLNISVVGLPSGTPWSLVYEGNTIYVNGTNTTLTGVPRCEPILLYPGAVPGSYGQAFLPNASLVGSATYCANASVTFSFTEAWQFLLFVNPAITAYLYLTWTVGGFTNSFYSDWYCYGTCTTYRQWCVDNLCGPEPEPAYYPNGTTFQIQGPSYGTEYVTYWNGTGIGSYTGAGLDANITIDGPINETGWAGSFGVYNETFGAPGLTSASTFHFSFAGGNYSATGGSLAVVPSVATGAYHVTNIWATSSTAGWEYFGQPLTGNPVVVPAVLEVNFSFAYVDVGGATGTIAFHAAGLTAGTVWRFAFNGTVLSSDTPYINVTEHSGTFPIAGYPVVSANGSAGYTPTGLGSTMAVTAGNTYTISFVTAYRVVAAAGSGGSLGGLGHGTFWIASGGTADFKAVPSSGFAFGGWAGTGAGSYTGGAIWANVTVNNPITESAVFLSQSPAHYNLTFVANGLASGTWWTVYLSGVGYSSNAPSLTVPDLNPCGATGTYTLNVPYAYTNGTNLTRYTPGNYPHTVCTNGQTVQTLTFSAQYFLTLEATNGGLAEATVGASVYLGSTWVTQGGAVSLSVAATPPYAFLGWNGTGAGSYTGTIPTATVLMENPVTEVAAFAVPVTPPPVRYWLDLHLSTSLAPGTPWSVTVAGAGYSATGPDLNITGLKAGSYALSVPKTFSADGLTQYAPISPPTSVTLTNNKTLPLTFAESFWVSVSASFGGTVVSPSSQWTSNNAVLTLNATPLDGYVFVGWQGSGAGSYSGSSPTGSVRVTGPLSEIANFAPVPPASQTVSSPSVWNAPTTWIGLAAVGLIAGLAVGLLLFGRRPPPPSADSELAPAPDDEVPFAAEGTAEPEPADTPGEGA